MLPLYQQRNLYNNMADVNKPKLQLRSGLSINGDKTPSPATKLLINHGKPNFTIPRTHKAQNGNAKAISPTPAATGHYHYNNNNNEFMVKSTTFNGVFKPSNISAAAKQTLPQNGNTISRNGNSDNEAAKVVLRRPKVAQTETREREDDENVPEFIRRQRRIQERLANQNILDFENRRSGYFTQVLISPSSPSRKSFVETMASPAVKPGLEMPPPAPQYENNKLEQTLKEKEAEQAPQEHNHQENETKNGEQTLSLEPVTLNGQLEEEEVAKAIEEVNKAVEGEDDEDHNKDSLQETKEGETEYKTAAENTLEFENEIQSEQDGRQLEYNTAAENTLEFEKEIQPVQDERQLEEKVAAAVTAEEPEVSCVLANTQEQKLQESCQDAGTNAAESVTANAVEQPNLSNGHIEEQHHENAILKPEELDTGVTISHVNGTNGPSIPAPDSSGEKGVNYETKTVVSFSQELGNGDNKYPDTVKVTKDNEVPAADSDLKELTKLKFEIKADNQDIEVKPVLVNETA